MLTLDLRDGFRIQIMSRLPPRARPFGAPFLSEIYPVCRNWHDRNVRGDGEE